ncbi:amino acid adenylation domain-containing protein [Aerosakkonemataceae cyanobacterium BLCC-F154]|uniref:Amino acid adenylation domain-containing protein n=1 Tax=Floridaenema fluviatile BLCC-F154 TaxID=3153640 RepID=A0ABV4YKW7_9CYAN
MSHIINKQLKEFIEKSRLLTGQIIQEREPWNTEVTAQAIRHFAYGISDDNPLWLDPDYARKSDYGSLVAPPTFLISVLYPSLHGYPMKLSMSNLIGELEYEWFLPILEGDSLNSSAKQTGVYESKDRQNRPLVCILSETSYWNQKEELVGKAKSNLVWAALTENDFLVNRSIYEYSEEELAGIREALEQETRRSDRVLWGEDVEINTKLPPLVRGPLTLGDLICWQAAIGPSYRPGALGYRDTLKAPHTAVKNPITGWSIKNSQHHEDFLLAKQRGMPAPFDNGVMRFAWLSPLLTNWMGDRGQLKRLSVQTIAPVLYGDTIWYEGTVIKKTESESGILTKVKITGTNQLGELTTTGEGEILLPSRTRTPEEGSVEFILANSYPEEPCFHQLIEAQVERRPEAIALIDNHQQLTYREFNQQANQLAHYLKQFHLKPNTLIGICLDRSCEFAIAILAILKAGGAYLPLDPDYPAERLAFMLKDAQVPLVITRKELEKINPESDIKFVYLDSNHSEITEQSLENPADQVSSNHLAYAVYTSGSTGQPKAVCIPHYSLSSYLRSIVLPLGIEPSDKYLHTASFAFSAGVRQTLLPLFLGATLVIADRQQRQDPVRLFQLIKNTQVTIWDTVPTIWRFCIDFFQEIEDKTRFELLNNSLRLILVTGEPLAWNIPHDWRYQLQHNAQMINLYSQSETTGTVSYYIIPEHFNQQTGIVPLGKPVEDATIFLLDEHLNLVAEGEIGELCVAGKRQVRSYLNRPELTRKKFILNPFKGITHLYKTGDLARYSPEGILEFVGRSDRRIKIRGFRVELEGIEATLNQHPNVKETVVIARDDLPKDKNLVAYIATNNHPLNPAESNQLQEQFRNFLAEKLPEYAVPNFFVFLDTLPRNPNGKLERRNLPSPQSLTRQQSNFIAPRDRLELELTKIWESILETQPIGIQDNFFSWGGHSLLAVRLFAKIEQIFNQNLPLSILFDAPTIEQLANLLRQEGWSATWSSLVAIKPNGSKPPLFCVHGVGGNVLSYRNLAHYLPSDLPVYGLQALGLDRKQPYLTTIEAMAEHYLKEIQSVQPEGPYFLLAHSFGGKVILEMAHQLHKQGQNIALLALLDSSSPEQKFIPLSPAEEHKRKEKFISQLPPWSREPGISPLIEVLYQAKRRYEAKPYNGKVVYFKAKEQGSRNTDIFIENWRKLAKEGLDCYEVSGDHWSMLEEPHVQKLAKQIELCLAMNFS